MVPKGFSVFVVPLHSQLSVTIKFMNSGPFDLSHVVSAEHQTKIVITGDHYHYSKICFMII